MGVMRFLVLPARGADDWPEASAAYVTALDGRVFPCRVDLQQGMLSVTRAVSDSGKLHVPWTVAGYGQMVLTTASLPENERPYLLTLELARGKIGELRDQAFLWQFAGMMVPAEYTEAATLAFQLFSRSSALRSKPEEASRLAQQALDAACRASDVIGRAYTAQRLASRAMSTAHPPALLGCTVDESAREEPFASRFFDAFSAAEIPIEWRHVEPLEGQYRWEGVDELIDACHRRRTVIRGGPLVDLSPEGLPTWLAPWGDDFLNLQSFVCDFIETTVRKFAGRIRIWEVAARGNTGGVLSLTEEQRLALTARCLESAQRNDTDAQLFVRVDRPWGDYQAAGQHRLTPFQFVDALVRSSLGLSGINLEIAVGYEGVGGPPRDLLAYSRLIDMWSMLGVQLHVTLAFPSSSAADPQASLPVKPGRRAGNVPWSEADQAAWAEKFVSLLISKPQVTGVFWTNFHDGQPHRFPNAGAVRADGTPKPVLDVIRGLLQRRPPIDPPPTADSDGTWVEE
jgi:hypothetical protein